MRFEACECLHYERAEGGVWYWCSVGCIVSSTACLCLRIVHDKARTYAALPVKPSAFPPFLSNTRTPDLNLLLFCHYIRGMMRDITGLIRYGYLIHILIYKLFE